MEKSYDASTNTKPKRRLIKIVYSKLLRFRYEAVAVIFIAQLNNVTLTTAEVITISFIATIASLGLNSVPAGLVSILVRVFYSYTNND